MSAKGAIVLGLGIGTLLGGTFETERYPMRLEHSILENCISSYNEPLSTSRIRNKKKICICALEETIKEYDHKKYEKNQDDFLEKFENKSKECRQNKL